MTEDEARNAEAGAETDRRCYIILCGDAENVMPVEAFENSIDILQISRKPAGSNYARGVLRNKGFEVSITHAPKDDQIVVGVTKIVDGKFPRSLVSAKAPNEQLATARAILLLDAKWYIG